MRVVVLGKQGAGKGTQSQRLAARFGVQHLSTGDLFREAARRGTADGREAQRYMDTGELVPDDIVVGVVRDQLEDNGLLGRGFVFDGFPRTLVQARALDGVLSAHRRPLHAAVHLAVPTEEVLDRLAGRRVCETCGAVYHVNLPPKHDWVCDLDGGPVVQRDDDTEPAIMRRLELYEEVTVPILDYYRGEGILLDVDGVGDGDEVFERMVEGVEARLSPSPS